MGINGDQADALLIYEGIRVLAARTHAGGALMLDAESRTALHRAAVQVLTAFLTAQKAHRSAFGLTGRGKPTVVSSSHDSKVRPEADCWRVGGERAIRK